MKMRGWIGSLLLLNAIALAWQWDAFGRWGWGPNAQSEPERLKQEIKPELLNIFRPSPATPSAVVLPSSESENRADAASDANPSPAKTADNTQTRIPPAPLNTGTPAKPVSP
jgi:hypothetical protein